MSLALWMIATMLGMAILAWRLSRQDKRPSDPAMEASREHSGAPARKPADAKASKQQAHGTDVLFGDPPELQHREREQRNGA